jgi:hypothetical protein
MPTKVIINPVPGTVAVRPFPADQRVIVDQIQLTVVGLQNQQVPLAAFTDYQGYLGVAITPAGLQFADGTILQSAAGFWTPALLAVNLIAPTDNTAHHPGLLSIPAGLYVDLSASSGETLLEVI